MNFHRINPACCLVVLISIFIASPLLAVVVISIFSPLFNKLERDISAFLVVLTCVMFFSTVQPFSDVAEYLNIYNQIDKISVFGYTRFGMGIEFFILLVMKISHFISDGSEFFFLLIVYLVILSFLYKICCRMDNRFGLLVFIVIFYSYGFIQANSMILRQMLATVFLLTMVFSVGPIRIIYCLASVFSHLSISLGVILFFLVKQRRHRWVVFSCIALFFFLSILFYQSDMAVYVMGKLSSIGHGFSTLNTGQILIYNLPVVFITGLLFFYRKRLVWNDVSLFIVLYGVVSFIIFWGCISIPTLSNRLGMFICAFNVFLLYPLVSGRTSFSVKYISLLVVMMVNVVPATYTLYNIEMRGSELNFFDFKPLTSNVFDVFQIVIDRASGDMPYINQGNE